MGTKLNIIGIIPARMASSRFPGKPLAKIQEVPMVGHVYFRSKMSKLLDEVCVATCDNYDYGKKSGTSYTQVGVFGITRVSIARRVVCREVFIFPDPALRSCHKSRWPTRSQAVGLCVPSLSALTWRKCRKTKDTLVLKG